MAFSIPWALNGAAIVLTTSSLGLASDRVDQIHEAPSTNDPACPLSEAITVNGCS